MTGLPDSNPSKRPVSFGGGRWHITFRRDYLIYLRIGAWSVFLREPK